VTHDTAGWHRDKRRTEISDKKRETGQKEIKGRLLLFSDGMLVEEEDQ